jgi:hypothetical protein
MTGQTNVLKPIPRLLVAEPDAFIIPPGITGIAGGTNGMLGGVATDVDADVGEVGP